MYGHKSNDDTSFEARELINNWMSEKFCDNLLGDDEPSQEYYHDSEMFLNRLLEKENHKQLNVEPQVNLYDVDEEKSVNSWLNSMQDKLSSLTLSSYEAHEKEKKPVIVKDPRLAIEARQQKVREARARREEKIKLRLKQNMERKQTDAIAREIIRQEHQEKVHKKKIEEEVIQQEMAKIRKEMQDLKKKHAKNMAAKASNSPVEPISEQPTSSKQVKNFKSYSSEKTNQRILSIPCDTKQLKITSGVSPTIIDDHEDDYKQKQLVENIHRFEAFQKQKLMRKCMHHWIKIVLSKRAAMGKAKALAEWRILLKTWSAWRRYYFEEAALRDAQAHEAHLKQMNKQGRVASITYRKRVLRKCLGGWKKFVKMEQYRKELLHDQEETKRKMSALLGAVTQKQVSVNNDLVLEGIEDENSFDDNIQNVSLVTPGRIKPQEVKKTKSSGEIKQSTRKQAWQVRRSDVHKLTLKEIENMGSDASLPQAVTRVKQFKPDRPNLVTPSSRVQASKEVISQQREMISQQKKIINEQRRLLEEKSPPDVDSDENEVSNDVHETTKVKTFQLPKRPKSLLAMEKRAEERIRRKEELLERKRQAEKERLEKLRQEDEEQRRQEEEEKRKQQEERKRLKLLEIEKENERKALIAEMQQLRKKADSHYHVTLLSKYGFKPWLKFKQICVEKMNLAQRHHEMTSCRIVMTSWFTYVRDDRITKEEISNNFYSSLIRRRCFTNWLKYGQVMSVLEKKAEIHRNAVLKSLCVRTWERFVINERLDYFKKEEIALDHDNKRLLRRGFTLILQHKQTKKREEERNQRIADMRRKVAQLLPDFNPRTSCDDPGS